MNLVAHKTSKDNIILGCHKRNPPHDIKFIIQESSIFEGFQLKTQSYIFFYISV